MKKIFRIILSALLAVSPAFSFDWPQAEVMSDSFYSYFGQLRGGTISDSLIFSEPSEIKAADSGKVIVVISEANDDSVFFQSTLGNAVIVAHQDSLLTVYGNIDGETIPPDLYKGTEVSTGSPLGSSGSSGWQQKQSRLEFQVIDTKNNTAINPRVLMPRIGKELPLVFSGTYLQNKTGTRYDMQTQRTLPAGLYRVYRKRQNIAIPYKTQVSVNGIVADTISYDLLLQDSGKICAAGRKNYPIEMLYPDSDIQLMGELTLTPGRNTLGLTLFDILGKEVSTSFMMNIY